MSAQSEGTPAKVDIGLGRERRRVMKLLHEHCHC